MCSVAAVMVSNAKATMARVAQRCQEVQVRPWCSSSGQAGPQTPSRGLGRGTQHLQLAPRDPAAGELLGEERLEIVAAAHDHRIGFLQQAPECTHHAAEVVADLAVVVRVDTRLGELLADPGTVGVDDLPEEQLGSDGEDVTAHRGAA